MSAAVQLDKTYARDLGDFGTMSVRVIVLPREEGKEGSPTAAEDEDDFALAIGKSPIDSYLERADGRGKMCVLFQLNGQRQDYLDQSFIAKDLQFRYLRNRMMILVELDKLHQRALNKLLKGDRVGLFRGDVFAVVRQRLLDTLKKDPDLERLEAEAEEQVASLDSGTDAIRKKLDELITEHHKNATDTLDLPPPEGAQPRLAFGDPRAQTVVLPVDGGGKASGPLLDSSAPNTIRLRPDGGRRTIDVRAQPPESWATAQAFDVRVVPPVDGLHLRTEDLEAGKRLQIEFQPSEDDDEDEYPIETTIQIVAKFDGHDELRLLEKRIEIVPRKEPKKRRKVVLLSDPTWLKVVTRQPVILVPGGPTTHVRLKWNGKDELVNGLHPAWRIETRCVTLQAFPKVTRTNPREGRFELLIDTPRALLAAQDLTFEVEAVGPKGKRLRAEFVGRLELPPEPESPGTRKRKVAELRLTNPRLYDFRLIREEQWHASPYWTRPNWDAQSAGCFFAPTAKDPLVLVVNEDFAPLKAAREEMVKKGLLEGTISERVTKYHTHVALHLYAMYRDKTTSESNGDPDLEAVPHAAMEDFLDGEIVRTANTILRLLA